MLEQLFIAILAGMVFGGYGYLTKAYDPEEGYESFSFKKFFRTVFVYAAAGAIVGYAGDPVTQGNIESATAFTVILGEVFDKLWARFIKGNLGL